MAILDFIKNRNQPSAEQTAQPQPETLKQQMASQDGGKQVEPKSPLVRPEQEPKFAEAQALYAKGTEQSPSSTPAPTPTPAPAGADNPQPMQQKGVGEERVASEMSPTSSLASARAQDVDGQHRPPRRQNPSSKPWRVPRLLGSAK
jgi:hypothetical protein